jgi:hypothetical protein
MSHVRMDWGGHRGARADVNGVWTGRIFLWPPGREVFGPVNLFVRKSLRDAQSCAVIRHPQLYALAVALLEYRIVYLDERGYHTAVAHRSAASAGGCREAAIE